MKSVETREIHDGTEPFRRLLTSPEYEKLRKRLVRLFARRRCRAPEDLADETFSRVLAKIPAIAEEYQGDPIRYFYGIARKIYLEHWRNPVACPLEEDFDVATPPDDPRVETLHECLEACMEELDPDERELILEYYVHDKSVKIDYRKKLAEQRGLAMNALRIRAYRIRQRLHDRMLDRLGGRGRTSK